MRNRILCQFAEQNPDAYAQFAQSLDPVTFTVVDRLSVGTHAVSFEPQFVGPTYAMAVGSTIWFVPPRGEMIRIEP